MVCFQLNSTSVSIDKNKGPNLIFFRISFIFRFQIETIYRIIFFVIDYARIEWKLIFHWSRLPFIKTIIFFFLIFSWGKCVLVWWIFNLKSEASIVYLSAFESKCDYNCCMNNGDVVIFPHSIVHCALNYGFFDR